MRRNKEIMLLFALLVLGAALVLWYVIDRRAKNRAAAPPVAVAPATRTGPAADAIPAEPVGLGGKNERKTIDFTSGKPVVKDSAEDKAAIDAALKDMAEATKDVTFEAPKKKPELPPAPPKN